MSPIVTTMIFALLLGLVAGAIMQRSAFCMTAAFRDLFLFRQTTMLAALFCLSPSAPSSLSSCAC